MASYDDIVNLALRRSLFYPASEIYASAPAGVYSFGPYGAAMRRKIIDLWRKELVHKENFLELEGALILPEDVLKASGHLTNFNDPMTQCTKCNTVHRADKLLQEKTGKEFKEAQSDVELTAALRDNKLLCPKCKGQLSGVRKFNMTVSTGLGAVTKTTAYLRPETCQTLFVDFLRMTKTMRVKLPQGLAQVGKVFRNEISPRQTILREVEFAQMEAEIFFDPAFIDNVDSFDAVADYKINIMRAGKKETEPVKAKELVAQKIVSGKLIAYYLARTQQLYEKYGFPAQKLRFRELDGDERAFYAKEAFDFEVETSLGWVELIANNYRTDYDLKKHSEGSKKDLSYVYDTGKKVLPHVWEISMGLDRTFYAILDNSYRNEGERTWLSLPVQIAPMQAAVFPLLSNKPELVQKAQQIYKELHDCYDLFYDDTGSIGKRYARMDEVGCPFCITVDFDSIANGDVTIRERDATKQKRIKISDLRQTLFELISGIKKLGG